jgi:L-ribulose-5-phosphate 4-epimerase
MLEAMKEAVLQANLELEKFGLVTLGWGNVSGIDRLHGAVAIRPSGVSCSRLRARDMVIVDLDGRILEGSLNPSSDMATHVALYRGFPEIGGIAHSHCEHAVMFAQANCEIPCLGTTHADYFNGPVPVTRLLSEAEVEENYELHTGRAIIDRFENLEPLEIPGVLVAGHGPFVWDRSPDTAVKNMLVLEKVAQMAVGTINLGQANQKRWPSLELPDYILHKHYQRKHGMNT